MNGLKFHMYARCIHVQKERAKAKTLRQQQCCPRIHTAMCPPCRQGCRGLLTHCWRTSGWSSRSASWCRCPSGCRDLSDRKWRKTGTTHWVAAASVERLLGIDVVEDFVVVHGVAVNGVVIVEPSVHGAERMTVNDGLVSSVQHVFEVTNMNEPLVSLSGRFVKQMCTEAPGHKKHFLVAPFSVASWVMVVPIPST